MTPEQKTAWVKALRSGEYKQGRAFLKVKREDGTCLHCALGVFGEIAGVLTETPNWDLIDHRIVKVSTSFDGSGGGTTLLSPFLLPFNFQSKVHKLNDTGYSFAAIADMIESGEWDEPIRNSELP